MKIWITTEADRSFKRPFGLLHPGSESDVESLKAAALQWLSQEPVLEIVGDAVDLEAVEEVKLDGTVIVAKGAKAAGLVTEATSGRMWGAGTVTIHVGWVLTKTGFRLFTGLRQHRQIQPAGKQTFKGSDHTSRFRSSRFDGNGHTAGCRILSRA